MSTKLDWDALRQKKSITSTNNGTSARKRYVARVKNVCMAIPFNSNETLLSFQKEAILRASAHRKLKKESKLSNRIQFIKLATPHFPQLVDCYGNDKLCEIAGDEDIIIFQTQSDDEQEDILYVNNNVPNMRTNNKSNNSHSHKSSPKRSKKKETIKDIRPQTAKNRPKPSWTKASNTPTPSSSLKYKSKSTKNKRSSLGIISGSSNLTKNMSNSNKKSRSKKKENKLGGKNSFSAMAQSKSGGDLHDGSYDSDKEEEEEEENSADSERSGYSQQSGHNSHSESDDADDDRKQYESNRKNVKKRKRNNKSSNINNSGFAAEIQAAKKTTTKRDFAAEEARSGRKHRENALKHGRSISLSGATMLHSGANKKKRTKKSKKNKNESIYASNVASKSSKSSKRANAFEFFSKGSSNNNNNNNDNNVIDAEKRKRKYRYGNRNINVIRASIIPYEEEQEQKPEHYLDLKYIHGYNGHSMRQNLFMSHDKRELIYPMARSAIMLNRENKTQRHWLDGREAISSICVHPKRPIIVTGHVQKGPDRAIIRVWNYRSLVLHKIIKKMHDAAVICASFSSVSGYLYTIGAGEMHKLILWNPEDLFKFDKKNENQDADEILNADYESKKKNFINCNIDIVSDLLLGKQDILGFELNPFISDLIDEFVCFGKKNVKYYEVKKRAERMRGRAVELILPLAKTIVMGKLGSKSSEYERVYNCCVWLQHSPSYYLVGGQTGTIYICYKACCLKKVTNLGFESQISCMIRYDTSSILVSCWDGKLCKLSTQQIGSNLNNKLRKLSQRIIYVPRSGDEESGLKTFSARCMLYDDDDNILYCGLRTNQIIAIDDIISDSAAEDNKLHSINLLLDAHYGSVTCLACHPFCTYFVTGSDDSTLRIWDARISECLSRFKFDEKEKPSCLRFSHSGDLLAVGLTTSKIVILAWDECNLSRVRAVIKMPFKIDKKLKKSQQLDARNSEFTTDITVIKWSLDDLNFAAGHIDAIAHIFSVDADTNDDELHIIPWNHSLDVSNGLIDIQWSQDSQWLLTFTKDQDLMVWHLNRKQMIFEHYLYWLDPDRVSFDGDDPLLAGWNVEGVFQSYLGWDGTDLNSISLTKQEFNKTSPINDYDLNTKTKQKQQRKCKLIASADNKGGYIRIHNYPALKEAAHHAYSGHANQCKVVEWTQNDEYLISVGGADRAVFQWKLTDKITDYIRKYKPIKSANPFKK